MNYLFHRQLDILNPDNITSGVTVVGNGGIGSFACLALSKMGVNKFELIDMDTVSIENISNQFFRKQDLGKPKAEVVKSIIEEYSPYPSNNLKIEVRVEKLETETVFKYPIVVACTDNIESRRIVYRSWNRDFSSRLYIDARMSKQHVHVFSLLKHMTKEMEEYERVYLSHPNVEVPCTERSIVYNVLYIASLIACNVKRYFMCEPVPFHIFYDFSSGYFNLEEKL